MKKHCIEAKNFGGFVTFYLSCVTYEMLLTYTGKN